MFAPSPASSPSKPRPSKKKRDGDSPQGQPKCDSDSDSDSDSINSDPEYEFDNKSEDEDSVGDCLSDEEDNYNSDEDVMEDEDKEDLVESLLSQKVLEGAMNMVKYLVETNLILIPSQELPQLVDLQKIPQIGESKNHPIIYSAVKQEANCELRIMKLAGATTNGSKREAFLKRTHPDAHYITLFQLGSSLDSTTHEFLMTSIKKLCKEIRTIEEEEALKAMTIQAALDIQSKGGGIPFTLNLLAYYINHRGAHELRGLLKRFAIHLIESGFQEYAKKNIIEELSLGDDAFKCIQHEFLRGGDLLERAAEKMKDVAKELNRLLETLRKEFGNEYIEYLRINSIIMEFLAAWAPDVDCLIFTAVIYNRMGKWRDAYGDRNPCRKGEGDVYDVRGFKDNDHEFAEGNIDEFVNHTMKADGKVGGLNSNKCAFCYMRTTAEEYLADNGWEHVCDLEGIDLKVYSYKEGHWAYPALIILHGPPCPIMNSDPKVEVDRKWINTSRKTSVAMTALDEFAKMLRTPDANQLFSKDFNDYLVLGNILVMQCMIEYLVVNLHLHRMAASVIAKDLRVNYNVLCQEHTGLILKGTPRLCGKKPGQKRDFRVHTKLRNALSQTKKSEQERINNCVEILRKLLPDYTTEEDKERRLRAQKQQLRRAVGKIGLDDRIRKQILNAWKLKLKERIQDLTEEIEIEEQQNADVFAAMLARATNVNEE
mmetsp:Transcript_14177/g.28929  ORF Transcript_14177/g.28929 Transcript_14177/m.28929 type:complete len:711 (+) Transcript_14177:74-2206(+)